MARKTSTPEEPARKRGTDASRPTRRKAETEAAPPQTPEELMRASLKAFRLENLLGLGAAGATPTESPLPGLGFNPLDSFGLRKFEDVFDQRVAGALRRLGWPEPEAVQALQQEIEHLRTELEALRKAQGAAKRSASAKRARG